MNLKLKIGLLVVLVVLVVFPKQADASALSLGISPTILQIDALPPASIKAPIGIQNLGEETVDLKILLKPFTAHTSENGEVEYGGADPLIFQKIQIFDEDHSIDSLILAPSQEKNLTLHIGLLKDELPRDYYFSITFLSQNRSDEKSNSSQTPGGISTNVLLSVGPKGEAKGVIEEFSAPLFSEAGPVPFTLRLKNTGAHVIAPTGTILIKNMFGQTVGKVDLLPVNILAGTIRAIPDSLQSPDATPSANGQWPMANGKWPKALWRESFLLGPYTATLTISLSDQGPLLTRTIRFIGLPVQALIGLVIAILLILTVRNRLKRHLSP